MFYQTQTSCQAHRSIHTRNIISNYKRNLTGKFSYIECLMTTLTPYNTMIKRIRLPNERFYEHNLSRITMTESLQ